MRLPTLPADEPTRLIKAGGEQGEESFVALFEKLRAERRGLIAVSGHIGSIDLLAGAFALRGLPMYGLADDSAYPELFEEMNAQRKRWEIEIIPWRNLRRVFSALREPAILGLVVDWGYRPDGIPVRLFGEWTALPAGPAMLAAKTRAAIVPVVCRRLDNGTYEARHYDPIEVADTDASRDCCAPPRQIADALEDMISVAPEQWYSFKPIWPDTQAEKDELGSARREHGARRVTAVNAAGGREATPAPAATVRGSLWQRAACVSLPPSCAGSPTARCNASRRALGGALYRAQPARRRLVRGNLERVVAYLAAHDMANDVARRPPTEPTALDRLTRAAFGHYVRSYLESATLPPLRAPERPSARITAGRSPPLAREALARRRTAAG